MPKLPRWWKDVNSPLLVEHYFRTFCNPNCNCRKVFETRYDFDHGSHGRKLLFEARGLKVASMNLAEERAFDVVFTELFTRLEDAPNQRILFKVLHCLNHYEH